MENTVKKPHWTFGYVIRKKPIKFAALTIFFVVALLKAVDSVLPSIVRALGLHLGDAFFITAIAAAVVLAMFLSGTVLKVISNARLAAMKPADAEKLFEQQSHFFWSRIYSFVIGYIVLLLLIDLSFVVEEYISFVPLAFLVCCVLPILLANLVARGLNALMIRLTGTNKELVAEFKAGLHNHEIPEKCRNAEDMQGILRTLENAEAGSVRVAVVVYRVKKAVVRFVKNFLKDAGKAMLIAAAIGAVLGMGMSTMVNNEIDANMADWRRQRQAEDRRRELEKTVNQKVNGAVNYELKKRGL